MARSDFRRVRANISRFRRSIDRVITSEIESAAERMRSEITRRAPVDTGRLRQDIQVETGKLVSGSDTVSSARPGEIARAVLVGQTVPYDPHVEFGTRHMAARPFVRPAFDTQGHDLAKQLEKKIAKALDRKADLG